MSEPLTLKPVSVANLRLPDAVSQELKNIAISEGSKDLDTPEEFRRAADYLREIGSSIHRSANLLGGIVPFASLSAFLDVQTSEGIFRYRAIVNRGNEGFLIRENVATGETVEILQDVRGCDYREGKILQILTDGEDIYVSFEGSEKRGVVAGKVVLSDDGKEFIKFVILKGPIAELNFVAGEVVAVEVGAKEFVKVSLKDKPVEGRYTYCKL